MISVKRMASLVPNRKFAPDIWEFISIPRKALARHKQQALQLPDINSEGTKTGESWDLLRH